MKTIYLFLLASLLLCSCRSSRSMQKEINPMKSDLFYELTSPAYQEKPNEPYIWTLLTTPIWTTIPQ